MIGFVTRDLPPGPMHAEGTIAVFVPTAPNPTSGALLFLPESSVLPTSLTAEEAFKVVLSGGVIVPENLSAGPPSGSSGRAPRRPAPAATACWARRPPPAARRSRPP